MIIYWFYKILIKVGFSITFINIFLFIELIELEEIICIEIYSMIIYLISYSFKGKYLINFKERFLQLKNYYNL